VVLLLLLVVTLVVSVRPSTAPECARGLCWSAYRTRVVNCSCGGPERDVGLELALRYARGALVVAAMGNNNVITPHYPVAFLGVMAVGAVDVWMQRWTEGPMRGSNLGTWIDLLAPRVAVLSTSPGITTTLATGPSTAAPHVSRVAALVLAHKPSLTAPQVVDLLRGTARPLGDSDPGRFQQYRAGIVDALDALRNA
jgi:subtilisin family serine protease